MLKAYRIENRRYGNSVQFIAFWGRHQSIPLENLGGVPFGITKKHNIMRFLDHICMTFSCNTYYILFLLKSKIVDMDTVRNLSRSKDLADRFLSNT